jgi:hypothetical protein
MIGEHCEQIWNMTRKQITRRKSEVGDPINRSAYLLGILLALVVGRFCRA